MITKDEAIAKQLAGVLNVKKIWGNVIYNVREYGAKGNGSSDDTYAIQKAINTAHDDGGGIIFFPAGTYLVSGIELKDNILLQGAGKNISILKLIDNSNQHTVYTTNFDDLVGTSPSEGDYGVKTAGLRMMKIDGNGDNQTVEKHGLAYYGIDCCLEDVAITGARGWGIYREAPGVWYSPGGWRAYGLNAQDDIRFIEVYENWKGNFYYNGQSDSSLFSVLCYRVRGTKEGISGLANFHVGPKCNGIRVFGTHVWGDADYGLVNEANLATFTNTHVESASVAKIWVKAPIIFQGRVYEVASHTAAPAFLIESGFTGNNINASISQCKYAVQINGYDSGHSFYYITQYASIESSPALFVVGSGSLSRTNTILAKLSGSVSDFIEMTPHMAQVPGSTWTFKTDRDNYSFYTDFGGTHPQFGIEHSGSNSSYLAVIGGTTGNPPALIVRGSEANYDVRLIPKGNGKVRFGSHEQTTNANITGYITIKDSNGVERKLAVID